MRRAALPRLRARAAPARLAALLALVLAAAPAAALPRFLDRSAELPLAHVYDGGWEHFVGGGVAVFDCNRDGFAELFAAGGANPARLFLNTTGTPGAPIRFTLGRLPGLENLTGVTGAYPLDIDGDGEMDLAVLRAGPNLLLKGEGDCRFRDATADWGFEPGQAWSTAFAATWEPGRALPTLAIGNYVDRDDPEGPFGACDDNELHRPAGAGYDAPLPLSPGFCALSMLFTDWTRSGRPDLRVSNDRHYYVRGGAEQMWRLDPLGLLGPGDHWPQVSLWGMGIASRDLTGDGYPEVMTTSMGDQLLQIAEPGQGYVNAPYAIGTYAQRPFLGDDGRPSTGWHAQFGDTDNDGRDDLFIAKGNVDQMPSNAAKDPNNLLWQRADGSFSETAASAGVASTARSRGAALYDLNLDGKLDLVVVNRRAPMELYENVTDTGGHHWLELQLAASGPNRLAVGAWIELRLPSGQRQSREITVGGGHAGGQAGLEHFGLGAAESAEVRVIGPHGGATPWITIPADTRATLDVTRPFPALAPWP